MYDSKGVFEHVVNVDNVGLNPYLVINKKKTPQGKTIASCCSAKRIEEIVQCN